MFVFDYGVVGAPGLILTVQFSSSAMTDVS
jgi:hypothetical protein